jgi:2-dehydropantoate 2-reductase
MYGAGAIGGAFGGKLTLAGHEVILIARGAHLEALQRHGLTLHPGDGAPLSIPLSAVGNPSEIDFRDGDVVFLTMKSQDTAAALDNLRLAAGDRVPIVCAQNSVSNERTALRCFPRVYGMVLFMPVTFLEPGVVHASMWPVTGIADLGCYPKGTDDLANTIAADLEAAGFTSRAVPDIMRWKYTKLRDSVGNVVQAVCGRVPEGPELTAALQAEAEAVFAAAGIDWAPKEEFAARNEQRSPSSGARFGSSTWQSLARGTGSIEVDYFNGEIVLLGRLHGVPTPANAAFQLAALRLAHARGEPGSVSIEEMRCEIEAREQAYAGA